MQIYVVKPGDTIWNIARRYRIPPQSLLVTNGITGAARLVIGQTLVIPVGGVPKAYGTMEANGFIQPSNPQRERSVLAESARSLTYVTPFSHHVNPDGTLTALNTGTIEAVSAANRAALLLSVTNITGTAGANFNTVLIDTIINSSRLKQNLINNILIQLRRGNYKGVIIDFEKISPSNRNKYNQFLRELTARLHPRYLTGAALAPKTSDVTTGAWHGAHDYRAIGEIVDFVVIMTYEWGWSGGPPMAVAPIDQVRKVINYAVSVIRPGKIMMGIPLYGYDWTLPYVEGGKFAKAIGNQEAIDLAGAQNAAISYDYKAQSPHYGYTDRNGRRHIVWFEDARSVEAKYKLAAAYKLRGVSFWSLAKPFPQNWRVLQNMFTIRKY